MTTPLSPAAQKVQDALKAHGFSNEIIELPDSTRSAAEAAQAIGCRVEQIAKSLIFKTRRNQQPLLVIASGINRVDEKRLAGLAGEAVEKADAEFVRQKTGFVIGGVPPLGHAEEIETYLDEDLLTYETIWAAAGTPHAVFCLTPSELEALTGGKIAAIKKSA